MWPQNEQLGGLCKRVCDQQPVLMSSRWSQGRRAQFRSSIFGSFWTSFWNTWGAKTGPKEEVCCRCTFGSEICLKNCWFWFQIRTEWRWYVTRSSEMRNVDFWTTVHAFWCILVFPNVRLSWVVEVQINLKTKIWRKLQQKRSKNESGSEVAFENVLEGGSEFACSK